jgi:hypothetical protein
LVIEDDWDFDRCLSSVDDVAGSDEPPVVELERVVGLLLVAEESAFSAVLNEFVKLRRGLLILSVEASSG